MHATGSAATKRLNLADMEDLVRLAHTAHTLTPDLITDTVVDHVTPWSASWLITGCSGWECTIRPPARMQPWHGRPMMTRSQDFDAMSAHYGYAPVCAVLSHHHVAVVSYLLDRNNNHHRPHHLFLAPPPLLSRPLQDCEGCPALAGVRNLGLDDPRAVRPPAVGSEFLKALTRELRYQFERIQAQCCEFGSRTGRCV